MDGTTRLARFPLGPLGDDATRALSAADPHDALERVDPAAQGRVVRELTRGHAECRQHLLVFALVLGCADVWLPVSVILGLPNGWVTAAAWLPVSTVSVVVLYRLWPNLTAHRRLERAIRARAT